MTTPASAAPAAKPAAAPATSTAVVKKPLSKVDSLKVLVSSDKFRAELQYCLPKHLTAERQARILCTILTKNPKLAECDQASLINCMLDCSAMGLEPDGRRAHLIPYGKTCTLIVDYKGLLELIYRSEKVDFIDAFPVYANELAVDEASGKPRFEIEFGQEPKVYHKPILVGPKGNFVGAYAIAHIKGISKPKCVWMDKEDIDNIRKRSKAANSGPWVTDYIEMAKKTTIRRISKTLPLSYEINDLLMREIQHEHGETGETGNLRPLRPVSVVNTDRLTAALPEPETPPQTETTPAAQDSKPDDDYIPMGNETDQQQETVDEPPTEEKPPAAATPEPVKPATAAAPKQAVVQADTASIAQLGEACVREGITERQLCKWASKTFRLADCDTIEQMAEFAPRRVKVILDGLPNFLAAIKETQV